MKERRLFVKSDNGYSDRFIKPTDMFKKATNMNTNLPEERQFANGECIITDNDETAYSINELLNLLNYFNRLTLPKRETEDIIKVLEDTIDEAERIINNTASRYARDEWEKIKKEKENIIRHL